MHNPVAIEAPRAPIPQTLGHEKAQKGPRLFSVACVASMDAAGIRPADNARRVKDGNRGCSVPIFYPTSFCLNDCPPGHAMSRVFAGRQVNHFRTFHAQACPPEVGLRSQTAVRRYRSGSCMVATICASDRTMGSLRCEWFGRKDRGHHCLWLRSPCRAKRLSIRTYRVYDDFRPLNLAARERKEHKDGFNSLRSLRSLAANSPWLRP